MPHATSARMTRPSVVGKVHGDQTVNFRVCLGGIGCFFASGNQAHATVPKQPNGGGTWRCVRRCSNDEKPRDARTSFHRLGGHDARWVQCSWLNGRHDHRRLALGQTTRTSGGIARSRFAKKRFFEMMVFRQVSFDIGEPKVDRCLIHVCQHQTAKTNMLTYFFLWCTFCQKWCCGAF